MIARRTPSVVCSHCSAGNQLASRPSPRTLTGGGPGFAGANTCAASTIVRSSTKYADWVGWTLAITSTRAPPAGFATNVHCGAPLLPLDLAAEIECGRTDRTRAIASRALPRQMLCAETTPFECPEPPHAAAPLA